MGVTLGSDVGFCAQAVPLPEIYITILIRTPQTSAAFHTMTVLGRKTFPMKISVCVYIAPFIALIV